MNKKIKYLLFFVSIFNALFCFAQQNKIDSLRAVLKNLSAAHSAEFMPTIKGQAVGLSFDTIRISTLNALAWELKHNNPDTAIILSAKALQLSEKYKWIKGEAVSYNELGVFNYYKGNYTLSLDNYFKAIKIWQSLHHKKGIFTTLGNIGNVYNRQGDYPKALDYFFKALKMAEELKNKIGISRQLSGIGTIYDMQGDYPKALDYYFKALKMAKELRDKDEIAICLMNIGNVYRSQTDYPKALDNYFKALKISEELGNKSEIAMTQCNIGGVYFNQKNYPKALNNYFNSLKTFEELQDKTNTVECYGSIGQLYISTQRYNEAEKYLQKALALSTKINALDLVKEIQKQFSLLYTQTHQPAKALEHYKKYIAAKDSIFNEENTKKTVRSEMNFEFDKKEAVANAEHKSEMEKQAAIAEEKNEKQKIIIFSIIIGLLLVAIFAGFIFRALRITNKQKKIIESQNFQIVESINYSKKIQDSLLPSLENMQKSISNLFIFYEPKAIVSGDFYYFKQFEKYTLLACVDCTGHGVPGGFMSTLGSLLLDKIANDEALSPSEILSKLSDEIIRVLHQQSGGEIQDGMDLSICLIDKYNHKIEFSGARNGIIIITNQEVKRYKANPLPVGGNYMKKGVAIERDFKTQSILINPTDWIYMYTDGFMEQVGGQEGVPMNYTQFENQLIRVSQKYTIEEKNKFLQTELNNWRGTHERDDDVLIMGFQVD